MSDFYYIRSIERRIERMENGAHGDNLQRIQALSVALLVAGALLASCSLAGIIAMAVR